MGMGEDKGGTTNHVQDVGEAEESTGENGDDIMDFFLARPSKPNQSQYPVPF